MDDERDRRLARSGDGYEGGGRARGLGKIVEKDHESDDSEEERKDEKPKKPKPKPGQGQSAMSQSDDSSFIPDENSRDIGRNYDQQFEELERNINALNLDNEELQKKIAIIYEFKKTYTNEEKVYNKDTNINQSTYTDSLTSAANLYNELNTHRKRLNADLSKYEQSINIQKERKKEVYDILMKYKQELIANARTKQDKPISDEQIRIWFEKERQDEEEVSFNIQTPEEISHNNLSPFLILFLLLLTLNPLD